MLYFPKYSDKQAWDNNVDPDQTVPIMVIWFVSTFYHDMTIQAEPYWNQNEQIKQSCNKSIACKVSIAEAYENKYGFKGGKTAP